MAKVTMTLEGMGPLQRALKTAPDVVAELTSAAVTATSFAVAQRARALVPGPPARSKNRSARRRPGKRPVGRRLESGPPSPDAFYWRFVEFGTVRHPARPFFRPAAEAESTDYVARIRAIGPQLRARPVGLEVYLRWPAPR